MAKKRVVQARPTKEELEQIAQETRAWLESEKGQATMEKALREAAEAVAILREARRIKPEDLLQPITI